MARRSSEFGGHAGRVAPLPHELSAVEQARLERATDATEPTEDSATERVREAGRRGIGPVDTKGDL